MIGHCDNAARTLGGVVRLTFHYRSFPCSSFCLAFSPRSSFGGMWAAAFCTCTEAAQQVCLYLPIERLTLSRGPDVVTQIDGIRNQTEGSPYFE